MSYSKTKSLFFAAVLALGTVGVNAKPLKIMIINQCGAYVHTNGINALSNYLTTTVAAAHTDWTIVVPGGTAGSASTVTRTKFNDDTLATYNVIIWNSNTSSGNVITDANQRLAYQRWCRRGGATVAWHGFLDHADLWGFVTDSLLGGTRFTDHSPWNSTAGATAKVQWDTLKVNGVVAAQKSEYNGLKAGFPAGAFPTPGTRSTFTYPDEWYSFRSNPRNATPSAVWGNYPRAVDVLYTIDEATYDPPAAVRMGADHPLAWSYKLPPLCNDTCNQGTFIFNARGHETGNFTGSGAGAAPNAVDVPTTGPTKNWITESIIWASTAGLKTGTSIRASDASYNGILRTEKQNGVLNVHVSSAGKHDVNIYTLAGKNVGHSSGNGEAQYSFSNLKGSSLYIVQVKSAKKTYTERVAL